MFLTKIKRSQFYQLVYEVEGKRKIVSTKTTDRYEAEKLLSTFTIPIEIIQNPAASLLKISQFKD